LVRPLAVGDEQSVGRSGGVSGRRGEVGVELREVVPMRDKTLRALQGCGCRKAEIDSPASAAPVAISARCSGITRTVMRSVKAMRPR
jgi:hypothetical protein